MAEIKKEGEKMEGKLYIVPTPIGNLKDITLRALEVLRAVDVIAAEDTRQSLKLLNHYEIKKPIISCHEHNEKGMSHGIVEQIKRGQNVALVTDAGTPGISDPGSILIKDCIESSVVIEVLPGATAVTTALVYSGLDSKVFTFIGFLPRENKDRRVLVEELENRKETIIFYEAPHRLIVTLLFLESNFGNRKISLCRELTKLHEEILRGNIEEMIEHYKELEPRGEYVLVMAGKSEEELSEEKKKKWENYSIEDHLLKYVKEGMDKKEAVKKVSKEREIPRSEVYKYSINLE